jgi:NADP-dependent 3-hydroxy acid dehydrogenase YdfG
VSGSVALVVGASSSIGGAIAARLTATHDVLHLWGRDRDALARVAARCGGAPSARAAVVDVRDGEALRTGLADVVASGPLRTVVWVAGLFDWASAEHADPDAWHRLLDVNLTAASVLAALTAPHLVASSPSALVLIGSGAGHTAYANNAAYVASKHGLTGLARALFFDLRDSGVKVSLVSPGLVAAGAGLSSPAGQTRPDELLQPDDVADAVDYILRSPAHVCPTELRLMPQRS